MNKKKRRVERAITDIEKCFAEARRQTFKGASLLDKLNTEILMKQYNSVDEVPMKYQEKLGTMMTPLFIGIMLYEDNLDSVLIATTELLLSRGYPRKKRKRSKGTKGSWLPDEMLNKLKEQYPNEEQRFNPGGYL